MKNMILEGKDDDRLQIVFAADKDSGDAVLIENIFGFASADTSSGDEGVIRRRGVFSYAKVAETIALGEKLYYDDVNDALILTAGSLKAVGLCHKAAASGDAMVEILLYGDAR